MLAYGSQLVATEYQEIATGYRPRNDSGGSQCAFALVHSVQKIPLRNGHNRSLRWGVSAHEPSFFRENGDSAVVLFIRARKSSVFILQYLGIWSIV